MRGNPCLRFPRFYQNYLLQNQNSESLRPFQYNSKHGDEYENANRTMGRDSQNTDRVDRALGAYIGVQFYSKRQVGPRHRGNYRPYRIQQSQKYIWRRPTAHHVSPSRTNYLTK
eukprot:sb/3476846/